MSAKMHCKACGVGWESVYTSRCWACGVEGSIGGLLLGSVPPPSGLRSTRLAGSIVEREAPDRMTDADVAAEVSG